MDKADSTWLGWSFETWLLHEIRAYNSYSGRNRPLAYYSLPSGADIDLILETRKSTLHSKGEVVGMEFKYAKRWRREWERTLRDLQQSGKTRVKRMIGVYRGDEKLIWDGFEVWPVGDFLLELHKGGIF